MKQSQRGERGQISILLALVVVGLLGFSALAIDGGLLLNDRRIAQNNADAAALAGGGEIAKRLDSADVFAANFNCSSSAVQTAMVDGLAQARQRGTANGHPLAASTSSGNGVDIKCVNGTLKYIDVDVVLTDQTDHVLSQFVTSGDLKNTVASTVRVFPRTPILPGYAIVALNDHRDDAAEFDGGGTGEVIIHNSGIFSNSGLTVNGSVKIEAGGEIHYVTTYDPNGKSVSVFPEPVKTDAIPKPSIDPPGCVNNTVQSPVSEGTLSPGRYTGLTVNNKKTLELQPGTYCFTGSVSVSGGATLKGSGVTLYFQSGGFSSAGNSQVNLSAPAKDSGEDLPGMLIYLAPGNTSGVDVLGTNTSTYTGTIFAPSAMINLGGTSSAMSGVSCQLIGDLVKVHGSTTIDIYYNQDDMYNMRPILNVLK